MRPRKMNYPGQQMPKMLLEKSGQIAPKRMKEIEPKWKQRQLWLSLVVEVNSDAAKNNIAQEPGMSGPRIKANWTWPNRRWQE